MKKLILTVLLGLLVLDFSYAQEEPPTPMNLPPLAVQSLFDENVRNEQFKDALRYGRWLIEYRPKTMEDHPNYRGDRNFRRMTQVYEGIAGQQSDPSLREAYIDSALIMYDRAIAIFDEDEIDHYQWGFNRARFIQSNQRDIENGRILTMEEYARLYELDPQRFIEAGDGYFINYLVSEKVNNGFRDEAIQIMNDAEPMAPQNVRDHFNETRSGLFRSPEERIAFLKTQLEEASTEERLSIQKELFELFGKAGNRDKQEEIARTLYEAEKSMENIMRMAEYAQNRANYRDAIRYYNEALQKATDNRKRAELNYSISENYFQLDELERSRSFAQNAIRLAPDWGTPLIHMAQIYATAVNQCTSGGLDRTDKVVYWLVIDYLERARRVDSSVSSSAQRNIASYQGITPSAEEKFYMNWENGDSIQVGANLNSCYGWISESTTVR